MVLSTRKPSSHRCQIILHFELCLLRGVLFHQLRKSEAWEQIHQLIDQVIHGSQTEFQTLSGCIKGTVQIQQAFHHQPGTKTKTKLSSETTAVKTLSAGLLLKLFDGRTENANSCQINWRNCLEHGEELQVRMPAHEPGATAEENYY